MNNKNRFTIGKEHYDLYLKKTKALATDRDASTEQNIVTQLNNIFNQAVLENDAHLLARASWLLTHYYGLAKQRALTSSEKKRLAAQEYASCKQAAHYGSLKGAMRATELCLTRQDIQEAQHFFKKSETLLKHLKTRQQKINSTELDYFERLKLKTSRLWTPTIDTVNQIPPLKAPASVCASASLSRSWHIDPDTKTSAKTKLQGQAYVLLPASTMDKTKVVHCYLRYPMPSYSITRVDVIYNPKFNRAFSLHLHKLQQRHSKPAFAPNWLTMAHAPLRHEVYKTFVHFTTPYTDTDVPNVKLLPAWHGTTSDVLESIFTTGYANLATTDSGFFGKGYYSTVEADYAYRVYSKKEGGALLLNWVACYSPLPVVADDMQTLELVGKNHYGNYDAHFVPVTSPIGKVPDAEIYYPCTAQQRAHYHELVVFESAAILPRYLIHLQADLLKTPSPSAFIPQAQGYPGCTAHALAFFNSTANTPILLPKDEAIFSIDIDAAALASQRAMHKIKIKGQEKTCRVIPAAPDGNCGFTAIRQSLLLQGYAALAEAFYRQKFIELIVRLYTAENTSKLITVFIQDIFKIDGILDLRIEEWQQRFTSPNYWLQDAHFRFLAQYYGLRFEFYCPSAEPDQHYFVPELGSESIDSKDTPHEKQIVVTLAHVSMKVLNHLDARLNHFDTLLIAPTAQQLQHIQKVDASLKDASSPFQQAFFKKEQEEKVLSSALQYSLFSPPTASNLHIDSALKEALQHAQIIPEQGLFKLVFQELHYAKAVQSLLMTHGIVNPNRPDEPRKIDVSKDMTQFILLLTAEEYKKHIEKETVDEQQPKSSSPASSASPSSTSPQ